MTSDNSRETLQDMLVDAKANLAAYNGYGGHHTRLMLASKVAALNAAIAALASTPAQAAAPAGQAVTESPGVPVERVRALAEKWRGKISADRTDDFHSGLRDAHEVCADELDALAQEGTSNG